MWTSQRRIWALLLLLLVVVVKDGFATSWLSSSSSKVHPRRPWWESSTLSWSPVDPDFNWNARHTGVSAEWKNTLGYWSHYNATGLSSTTTKDNNGCCIPWTTGRMCKSLRQLSETAFELKSVYEPEACGLWAFGFMKERTIDGMLELGHVFQKTPYRVTTLPETMVVLPQDMLDAGAAKSQVTLIKDAATFSGPRWLPSKEEAVRLQQTNDDKSFRHFQFCEMWLAETVEGIPEARKIGMFVQYDSITGELLQVFRMREVALPTSHDPDEPIDTNKLQDTAGAIWTDQQHLQSKAAKDFFASKELSVESVLKEYNTIHARAVQRTKENNGSEVTCCIDKEDKSNLPYFSPACNNERYFKCRFDDGVYACIPIRLDPEMNEMGFELGCFTVDGNFHRMLAFGTRDQGELRTIVYECWSKS